MSDAYWRYGDARQVPSSAMSSMIGKRSRADYDIPGHGDLPNYFLHDEDRGALRVIRDTESIGASYDRYLRSAQVSSFSGGQSTRPIGGGISIRPVDDPRLVVAHIFRPFVGYKEVRLVSKESRHPGGDPLVLCFVDFVSPAHAATAMDALQGYKFDEDDRDSVNLRLQFARHPGARSGAGHRGKR
ncbi:RNA-binding protein [Quillaja saponaria]|uniref:RNA-binding protein n=1 Tax=Quillaja saponaria TaxID=32244 RepID=A0AAD7PLE2_QUISA|nr:RNA-binding protein [Quillaja saponaria]